LQQKSVDDAVFIDVEWSWRSFPLFLEFSI